MASVTMSKSLREADARNPTLQASSGMGGERTWQRLSSSDDGSRLLKCDGKGDSTNASLFNFID